MQPDPATPLKVLHISGRSDHGGGPEHILQVVGAGLPGIQHHVACPESGVYWQRYQGRLGSERLCPIPHRSLSLPAMLRLRTFVRSRSIQVIHSHGMCGGVYGRALGVLTGLPVLHTFHGVPITPGLKHRVYQAAEHVLSHLTDCGIAVSTGEADIVNTRWRRYRGRLAVVPNGIELGGNPSWAAWPPVGGLRIVSFSRHNHQKHPELLIEIARCLKLMGVRYRIDAFGEGLEHASLVAEANKRGVGDVLNFHAPTDTPSAVLEGAHVYLSTSRWEGMPLAILEAWRAGLIVVASDVVGNRELVANGSRGFLFPDGQGRFAARIIRDLQLKPIIQLRECAAQYFKGSHGRCLMALRIEWLYRRIIDGIHSPRVNSIESPIGAALAGVVDVPGIYAAGS